MLRRFLKFTALGRVALIPIRLLGALPYAFRQIGLILRWAFTSKEHYNHTYHLTPLSRAYLISYTAVICGHPESEIETYFVELEEDEELRRSLVERALASPDRHNSDIEPRYGRRLGWYALVRATKPRVMVETGVDRGLGTVVIAAALRRNAKDGAPGMLYATDIVPACGHLMSDTYRQFAKILIGDSVEALKKFQHPVDIFIYDSDHRAEYEWAELVAIEPRLHSGSITMSDNSQQTAKLLEFSKRIDRSFLYFQDQPLNHWWPGDGIGAAFIPGRRYYFPDEK